MRSPTRVCFSEAGWIDLTPSNYDDVFSRWLLNGCLSLDEFQDIIGGGGGGGGDEESNCSTTDGCGGVVGGRNDRVPKTSEPPKKRTRSKSVGIEDKVVMDRGGLTASVVVAPSNDPTQPLSVVQVLGDFCGIRT